MPTSCSRVEKQRINAYYSCALFFDLHRSISVRSRELPDPPQYFGALSGGVRSLFKLHALYNLRRSPPCFQGPFLRCSFGEHRKNMSVPLFFHLKQPPPLKEPKLRWSDPWGTRLFWWPTPQWDNFYGGAPKLWWPFSNGHRTYPVSATPPQQAPLSSYFFKCANSQMCPTGQW